MPDTIVLGMGNPILGDDGAGYRIAELLKQTNLWRGGSKVIPTSCDWICLLDQLDGFRRLIVIDTISTGEHSPGTLLKIPIRELCSRTPLYSIHHLSIPEALKAGTAMGLRMPESVRVYAIEIEPPRRYSERLSPQISSRIGPIADEIAAIEAATAPPGRPPSQREEDHAREEKRGAKPSDPSGSGDGPGPVREEAG